MKKLLILTTACTAGFAMPSMASAEEAQHGFLEDSKLTITAKNLYYDNDNRDSYSGQDREWGQGFILNFTSGFTEGTVGVGIDALGMFGYRLDGGGRNGKAGQDRNPGNGNLFPTKHSGRSKESFGSFGVAPKIRISKTEIKYGTMMPNLPVVIANNGRLLPQTYDGGMITSKEFDKFTFIAGKLEHTKGRASTHYEPMSMAGAGKNIGSNKFYFGGVDYQVTKDLKLQYYYANLKEFYKQHFVGINYGFALPVGKLTTDVRYFHNSADGKNRSSSGRAEGYRTSGYLNNGKVDNQTWSLALTYQLDGHKLTGGYQRLTGNSNFAFINESSAYNIGGASTYLWTDIQLNRFASAGERSWFGMYDYNFADLDLPGLTMGVKYIHGNNLHNAQGKRVKEWERDIKVSYMIQSGPLKNLEFVWMNAMYRSGAADNVNENRLIANYTYIFDKF